jgi:hypothetical protein
MDNRLLTAFVAIQGRQIVFNDCNYQYASTDSSSDEELIIIHRKRHATRVKPTRMKLYVQNVVPYFTDKQFQMDFRLTQEAFETLLRIVAPRLQNNASTGRPTICVKKQLLAVIWLLGTPDSYRSEW